MKKLENFIFREIAGNNVMIPVGNTAQRFNGLIMANPVAAFIWEKIEDVNSVDELAKLITAEFDVTYEEAFNDCDELIKNLLEAKWIEK